MKVGISQPHGYAILLTLTGVWYGVTDHWEEDSC